MSDNGVNQEDERVDQHEDAGDDEVRARPFFRLGP